jgi:hypothetical protein
MNWTSDSESGSYASMTSQMIRAPSARSNPATPVPSAGMTRDSHPSSSARSSVLRVASYFKQGIPAFRPGGNATRY